MNAATFVALAVSIWGAGEPPPCGTIAPPEWHERIVAGEPRFERIRDTATGDELAGVAFVDECRFALSVDAWRAVDPARKCDLVVHEVGHLYLGSELGHRHPGMEPWHRFRACRRWWRATRPRPLRHRPDPYRPRFDLRG